jgi:CubicO group peptidase (beta-lactamase class C family)
MGRGVKLAASVAAVSYRKGESSHWGGVDGEQAVSRALIADDLDTEHMTPGAPAELVWQSNGLWDDWLRQGRQSIAKGSETALRCHGSWSMFVWVLLMLMLVM